MMSVHESSPWMFPGNPHNSHSPFVPSFPMNVPFAAAPAPASSFPPSFSTFTPSSSSSSAPFTLPSFNLFQQQQQPQPSPSPSFNAFGAPSVPVFDPFSSSSGVSGGSGSGSLSGSLRKTKRTMTQLDEDTDPLFRESRDFCSDDSEDSDSSVHTRGSHDSFRHLSEFPRKRSFDAYADRSITPVTSPSHTQSQSQAHPFSPSHSHSHSHSSSPSPSASASASSSASAWSQPPQKRVKSMFDKALEQLFEFRFDSSCERSRLDSRGGKRRKQMNGSPQLDVLEESEENDSVPNSPGPAPDAMGEDSTADTATATATATSSAAKGPLIEEEEEDDPVEARKKQVMLLPSALRYRLYPTVPLPEGVTFDEFFHRPSPHTAFCLLNTSGNILECDKGLPKLLKISADDLRGKSLLAFTHVDDWGMAQQVVRRLLHGDSSSELFHQRMIDANGDTIFVRGNLFRMERNDKVYIVSKITPYDGPASASASPSTIDPANSQLRRFTRNPRAAASFSSSESPSVFSSRPSATPTMSGSSTLSIEELPDLPSDNAMSCD